MKTCENCGSDHSGEYGSGRFCSLKCARGFSTKNNREKIKEKISNSLKGKGNGPVEKKCKFCDQKFTVAWNKRSQKCCSTSCATKESFSNEKTKIKLSNSLKKAYSDIDARNRLKEIGRLGGFGKKGKTKNGISYSSLLERECFELLENLKINFEAHKNIPKSAKETDIYLVDYDIWIELDGINREKRKKWLGQNYQYWIEKLELYASLKLKLKIVYTFSEFKEYVNIIKNETKTQI